MPPLGIFEEASRQPLARGTACHRCFVRKVRCTGQPDPASGMYACKACVRTARFKGHEVAYCRCAFSSDGDGLCSEEGGPNVLGDIYPQSGPSARRKLSSRSSSLASSSSGSQSDGSLAAASTSSSVSYASGTFIPASASALSAMCDASDYEHDLHFTDESARAKPSTSFELPPPIPLLPFSGASAFSLATHPTKRLPSDPPERQALAAWKGLVASTALDGRLGLALDASDAQQPSAIGSTISSAGVFHLPSFAAPSVAAQPHSDHTTIPAADVSSRSLLARRSKHSPMSIALPPPLTATPVETAVFAPAPSPRPLVEAEPPSLLVQTPASFAPCSSRPTAPVSAALPGRTRQNSQDATSFASTWSSGHALPGETLVTAASSYPPPSISAASPDLLRPEPCAYGFSTHSRDRDVTYTWCSLYGHSPRLPLDLPAPRPTSLAEPTHES
ncbi:hypothetical protein BMF94_0591 [Rhodotorula taiwanensis]|uniref:Uncharacterized protein n=1 Tax=Rhodotorula taiwanensis TaxID=741276 RepID=A0A2S5BI18_9BASI|nr:hypothetical protein BMF94_0591 [Rhodotorula taiwanensis]